MLSISHPKQNKTKQIPICHYSFQDAAVIPLSATSVAEGGACNVTGVQLLWDQKIVRIHLHAQCSKFIQIVCSLFEMATALICACSYTASGHLPPARGCRLLLTDALNPDNSYTPSKAKAAPISCVNQSSSSYKPDSEVKATVDFSMKRMVPGKMYSFAYSMTGFSWVPVFKYQPVCHSSFVLFLFENSTFPFNPRPQPPSYFVHIRAGPPRPPPRYRSPICSRVIRLLGTAMLLQLLSLPPHLLATPPALSQQRQRHQLLSPSCVI